MSIAVLLADDHKIMRDGPRSLIEREPDMEVVGEAEDGRTTVQLVRELSPDVVIMDITMPNMNGLEATRQILAEAPDVKVIALSMHSDRRFVVGMLRAGGSGYLPKDCAFEELVRAIRTVAANQAYLSPTIAGILVDDYVRHVPPGESSVFSVLTPREREVLQLLAEGWATKEVAHHLHTSIKTIETHRRHIMQKLGISSVAEMTKYAIREGLTSLDI